MSKRWLRVLAAVLVLGGAGLVVTWLERRQEQPPIHVALVGPITGSNPENGEAVLGGAELFVEQANRQGGIGGRRIVLDVYDDQNDPELARKRAQEIIDDGRAVAVVGHNYSACSIAAGPLYRSHGLPAITPTSTAPSVTVDNEWYFRTIFNDNLEGSFLASFMAELFAGQALAIIAESGPYAAELSAIVTEKSEQLGIEVGPKWTFEADSPQMDRSIAGIVDELLASGHEGVVLLAVHAPAGIELVKQLRAAKVDNELVAPNAIASRNFQTGFDAEPEEQLQPGFFTNGIYVSTPLLFDSADADGHRFRTTYMRRYGGSEPDWRSAFSYDAMLVIADAVRKTGISGQPDTIGDDRRAIRDYLADVTSVDRAIKGATGFNYFDATGDSRKPVNFGRFRGANIISTLTQFQEVAGIASVDVDSEIREGRMLAIDDRPMYRTNVVYVGMQTRSIDNIDLGQLSCTLDLDLWFRSQGVHDASDIDFLNAVESIELGAPVERATRGGISYRRYRVNGRFKMDYLPADTFEEHTVGVSFVHRRANRNHLIYVTDLVGMQPAHVGSAEAARGNDRLLSPASGWKVKDVQSFQDVIERGSQGDPRLLGSGVLGLTFSRFSSKIIIQRERLALRRSLSSDVATTVLIGSAVFMLVLLILSAGRRRHGVDQLVWLLYLGAGIAFLVALETALVDGLMEAVGRYHLEQITRVFDLLWWLVPALFLIYALEVFVWRPLERKAEQKIPSIVRRFVAFLILLLCFFGIIAFVYDQKITSLLATSGMIAMIIGLAIQINISNIFSGIALNLERPFKVGDWIKVGSFDETRVIDMTWRTTRLMLRDNTVLCVPNAVAAEAEVVNFHRPDESYELWIYFHADPSHPPERVIKIALDALNAHPKVLAEPKPGCRFIGYTEWSAEYVAVPVLTNYAKRNVERGAIMTHMWRELHRAGIREAIRVQEVHMLRGARATGAKSASPQEIITDVDIFEHLPDEAKEHLTRQMRGLSFAAGETIVEQDAEGDSLFIIVEGVVGVWVTVAGGEVIEVDRMGAGAFFGEMALLTGEARSASIKAVTDTRVYKITKDNMAPLIEGQPEMSRILSEELTTRTINRESKKSAYEDSQIDEQALFAKFLNKIQSFFGVQ